MLHFWAALSLLVFLNYAIDGYPPGPPKEANLDDNPSKCLIEEGKGDVIERMQCSPVGHDGRTLGEILRGTQAFVSSDVVRGSFTYFESAPGTQGSGPAVLFASRVKYLHLIIAGNLTITNDCFKGFTNLEHLNTNLELREGLLKAVVTIDRNAFQHTPNLKRLRLCQAFHFPEETLQAFESLKQVLETYW